MRVDRIKRVRQERRVRRVRNKVIGTPARPRLAVARSNRNIEAQIIDDLGGRTLCAVSSRTKDMRASVNYGGNAKAAADVGKALAEKARSMGIEAVCFDRRGRRFHGRIKALAQAAREAGLRF